MESYLDQVSSDKKESSASAETAAKYAAEKALESEQHALASEEAAKEAQQHAEDTSDNLDLAKRWAVGDSGSGDNEASDNNNSYYYAMLSKFYSNFNAPSIWIDFSTMSLMMEIEDSSEVMFRLDENKNLIMGECK